MIGKIRTFLIFIPMILFIIYLFEHTGLMRDIVLEYECKDGWNDDAEVYVNREMNNDKENPNVIIAKKYITEYYSKIKQKRKDAVTHDIVDILESPDKYYGKIIDLEGDVISAKSYKFYNEKNSFDMTFKEKIQFLEIETSNYIYIRALLVSNKYIDRFYRQYEKGDYVFIRGFVIGKFKNEDGKDCVAFMGIVI